MAIRARNRVPAETHIYLNSGHSQSDNHVAKLSRHLALCVQSRSLKTWHVNRNGLTVASLYISLPRDFL